MVAERRRGERKGEAWEGNLPDTSMVKFSVTHLSLKLYS